MVTPNNPKLLFTFLAACLVAVLAACSPQEGAMEEAPAEEAATATEETTAADYKPAPGPAEWSYSGETGPESWADLSADYAACDGQRQSPVDLTAMESVDLPDLSPDYGTGDLRWYNNGHALQAEVPEGSSLTVGDKTWNLLQFHLHTPSEHTVDGQSYPMTIHLVHSRGEGLTDLAVLGLLFEEAEADNPALAPLLAEVPQAKGDEVQVSGFDLASLLPENLNDYRYAGSLTTPPCSEVVSWHVVAEPVPASAAQIAALEAVMGDNARPVQPLNDRVIDKDNT